MTKRIIFEAPWGVEVEKPNQYARLVTQRCFRGQVEKFDVPTPLGTGREEGSAALDFSDPAIVWAESEEAFIARCWHNIKRTAALLNRQGRPVRPHITDQTAYAVIDEKDLPPDRTSRDRWRLEGGKVVVHG